MHFEQTAVTVSETHGSHTESDEKHRMFYSEQHNRLMSLLCSVFLVKKVLANNSSNGIRKTDKATSREVDQTQKSVLRKLIVTGLPGWQRVHVREQAEGGSEDRELSCRCKRPSPFQNLEQSCLRD